MTDSSYSQPRATITVPAAFLEDARTAIAHEVEMDAEALRAAGLQDRDVAAQILRRDVLLLDVLLDAADGDVELSAVRDNVSSPLFHLLEEMARVAADRLVDVLGFGPADMAAVAELTDRLRWAAGEATRIGEDAA